MRPPAPSRGPCFYCETPGFRGCAHWAPCDPVDVTKPPKGNGNAGKVRHHIGGLTCNGNRPGGRWS